MNPMRVGLIGCGNISTVYFEAGGRFRDLQIVACADRDPARAEAAAVRHAIPRVLDVANLPGDPEVDLVLNLTPPQAHTPVLRTAIAAGKHAYTEKPLGLSLAESISLLEQAGAAGVTIGCAPDTVLGAGIQTARKLIDDGWIGRPVSATAFMLCPGHESWHPDPAFYYAPGGGPLFDMGPYYLSALVTLLGPITQACAMTTAAASERIITSEARFGQAVPVAVPTHVSGTLAFESGALATLIMSFDAIGHSLPHLEIHGTEGSLQVADPNTFGGPIRLKRRGADAFADVPLSHTYASQSRGLGLAEMARAIQDGREPRASARMALHVLDCMEALHRSAGARTFVSLATRCPRPEPMPMNLLEGGVDS
ncbi:MAG: Gfo/Idh/MocA family oxidoreductase [Candidatus Hydrogenedentes bacterium]|nr:Gfo/Idh/MocA family oxidoreductase [Candidatus Hydrogenedentota bacterium]